MSIDRALSSRLWLVCAVCVAAAAFAARVHGAFVFPPINDLDGPGHLLNAYWLREGRLPPLESWLGFHPPLYHGMGALLWSVQPERLPVHVGMRLLSLASGAGAIFVVWRVLRRRFDAPDAAIIAALLPGVPVLGLAMSMLGNETACAFFTTWILIRLRSVPDEGRDVTRHSLVTGILGTLAVLSKSTGWLAVGVAAVTYAAHQRGRWSHAVRAALLVVALPIAIGGPFYARVVFAERGSALGLVTSAALSPDLALMMSRQPPGERSIGDYFSLPASTFLRPRFDQPGMLHSVPGMLYASIWADAHGHWVLLTERARRMAAIVAFAGLLPTALGLYGALRMLRRPAPGDLACLLLAAGLFCALLRYTWMLPTYSAVKASYLLPAVLPAALCLASGLAALGATARLFARALLLAISVAGSALTTYGWWH